MNGLSHRRSARPGLAPTALQRRWSNVARNRDVKVNPAKDEAADLALKIPILEAEILGLRHLLAEMKANREDLRKETDDLRRDRDHWQNLAKAAEQKKAGPRTWFCGRASPGA
jgi:FtsZ-binding cell division protein ZapB